MSGKFDADAIKASASIVNVIGSYVDLRQEGREYKGLCPFHGDTRPSFHVVPDKGFYHCFGCGDHGDVIDFLTSHTGASFKEACEALGGEVLPDARPIKQIPKKERANPYEGYKIQATTEKLCAGKKVDLINPKRDGKIWKDAVPVSVHCYLNPNSSLQGYVIRLEIDGQKLTPQVRYTDKGWAFHPFDEPRPIYNIQCLIDNPARQTMVVEGEKACDAIYKFIGDRVNVVSWSGGTNGVSKTDWTPLNKRKIVVIPDRDTPGIKAMNEVINLSKPANVKRILPSESLPKGWDVADQDWSCDKEIYDWCRANEVKDFPESYEDKIAPEPETLPVLVRPVVEVEVLDPEDDEVALELVGKHSIDSRMIAQVFKDKMTYDEYLSRWFKYEKVWKEVPPSVVKNFVTDIMDRSCPEGYQSNRFISTLAMLQMRMAVSSKDTSGGFKLDNWEVNKNLLPLNNGILNLHTKELIPHGPHHLMNWYLPHNWKDGGQEYPVIAKFLHSISGGDTTTVDTLLCFLAAVLKGMSHTQKFLEIIGTPGTGKSTFVKLACELVGVANLMATSMDMLQNNKFETANLYGKRLAIITDADKYGGSVEIFKAATGQDPLRYEVKNRQAGQSFIYQGMIIVAANQAVQYKDQSTAMMRRRVPVHIDHRLDEKDRDPDLSEKMSRELPGLLYDLVMLDERYIEDTLHDKLGKREFARNRSLVETNTPADWLNENIVICKDYPAKVGNCVRDGQKILNSDEWLYPNYVAFAEHTGRKAQFALNTFRKSMLEILHQMGVECTTYRNSGGAVIKGIRLREDTDSDVPTLITKEKCQS
tara:strand:- start:392 stop:2845 length:2454 start_codon:yes stop_codon:yes gene_type:complete